MYPLKSIEGKSIASMARFRFTSFKKNSLFNSQQNCYQMETIDQSNINYMEDKLTSQGTNFMHYQKRNACQIRNSQWKCDEQNFFSQVLQGKMQNWKTQIERQRTNFTIKQKFNFSSQQELEKIPTNYFDNFKKLKIIRKNVGQQILPQKDKRNILITSAIPYVNNVPHLGNIIGSVLSADSFARYARLRGYNTLYICGTDDYGTATEVKALQEKMTPQEICSKYFHIHKQIYEWFDIDFDFFGQTSTPIHTEITQEIFHHLHPKYTTEKTKLQTYCSHCQMYLSDRYVSGTCPHCKFKDARGDQCDSCSKLLDPVELIDSKCIVCKHTPEIKQSKHIYINLPQIQSQLEQWIHKSAKIGKWSQNSYNVSLAWLKQGLQERCITRDLKWGVQIPLKEYTKKVFYCWFDTPIGYMSITANFIKDWKKWWMNPDNVELFQFMGKDNILFHTVIFPSTVMGTGQPYTLLRTISTTEYLNYEDGKFSKSRGTGVFGDNAQDSGIPNEIFRYYLLINRPEKSDTIFTWKDFGNKNNQQLVPNLGKLVDKTLSFIYQNYNKAIPQVTLNQLTCKDLEFIHSFMNKFKNEYLATFEIVEIKEALKKAMELSSDINQYLENEKAFDQEQVESKRSDILFFIAANTIRVVSSSIEPFMPAVSAKINFILGFSNRTEQDDKLFEHILSFDKNESALLGLVKSGQAINQPVPIFREYKEEDLEKLRKAYKGKK